MFIYSNDGQSKTFTISVAIMADKKKYASLNENAKFIKKSESFTLYTLVVSKHISHEALGGGMTS